MFLLCERLLDGVLTTSDQEKYMTNDGSYIYSVAI